MSVQRGAAALVGVAAGAVTLGTAELAAVGLSRTAGSGGTPSPLLAVGGAFVDLTPPWLKDFAVTTFGTADKAALFVGMALVLLVLCAGIGMVGATGRRTLGLTSFAVVGAVGSLAVLTRPGAEPLDVLPTVLGVLAGLVVLSLLWARQGGPASPDVPVAANSSADATSEPTSGAPTSRRSVLGWAAALSAVGVLAVLAGRALGQAGEAVRAARVALRIPQVRDPVEVPDGADLAVPGLEPYVTPTEEFYRIDTALSVPQVDPATWRLRVTGRVDREVEIDLSQLLEERMVEALVTLTCVSNTVGGNLVGNAVWTGWPVRELLARAGVQEGADMVLSTSVDGWTAGTPLEVLTDERDAVLAVAMNGEPLPPQHGFPVRMVVPGLYGYVSATKWVTQLEVTRFADAQGYWTPRGWSERGPIKTASRIDVPRDNARVPAGEIVLAGVAWAQHRGIERVEVRVDGGDWREATLAAEPSVDAWRQWSLVWAAEPGAHSVAVRATDAEGRTQVEERVPPAPDGASGWHTIDVTVEGS